MFKSEEQFKEIQTKLDELICLVKKQVSKVFTAKEAVAYLGISLSYLYKLTSDGEIAFSKPHGKLIYFSKPDLDAWALKNRSRSQAELERGINEAA